MLAQKTFLTLDGRVLHDPRNSGFQQKAGYGCRLPSLAKWTAGKATHQFVIDEDSKIATGRRDNILVDVLTTDSREARTAAYELIGG